MPPGDTATKTVCVLVPVYNEQEVLPYFHERLRRVLDSLSLPSTVLYVNDGSTDGTLAILMDLCSRDERVACINLSRNFGKEIAMTAGLDHADGDAVIIIDADLQDPPELIPQLIEPWLNGFDIVHASRRKRTGESWLKRTTAYLFYRVLRRFSGSVEIPSDTGDFRLMSRRVVDALKQLREHHRFMKGLFNWVGFAKTAVYYDRDPRFAGSTKWNYWKLWNFSLEGITSFTIAPLKVATYVGLVTALGAFAYGLFIVAKTLIYGDPVAGFPSLAVLVTLLGGIQLCTLGIIGEYLGRVFNETKNRPLYYIESYRPARAGQSLQPATTAGGRAPVPASLFGSLSVRLVERDDNP